MHEKNKHIHIHVSNYSNTSQAVIYNFIFLNQGYSINNKKKKKKQSSEISAPNKERGYWFWLNKNQFGGHRTELCFLKFQFYTSKTFGSKNSTFILKMVDLILIWL